MLHDPWIDRQSKLHTGCSIKYGTFTKKIIKLSLIAAEKIKKAKIKHKFTCLFIFEHKYCLERRDINFFKKKILNWTKNTENKKAVELL